MSLNIKNSQAHDLAAQLARLRKVSLTTAVTDAVRHELDREKSQRRRDTLAAQLLEIGQRCAAHLSGAVSSSDHASILYDSDGLPR